LGGLQPAFYFCVNFENLEMKDRIRKRRERFGFDRPMFEAKTGVKAKTWATG